MATEIHDYSEFSRDTDQSRHQIGGNLIAALTDLADQLESAEELVADLEVKLEEAKKAARNLSEHEIPKLLDGMESKVTLPDKRVIEVTEKIRSSATGDRKIFAIKWLEDHGHGAMVKNQFILDFHKGQEEKVAAFEKILRDSGIHFNVKKERSIHHSTLEAFVRQSLEDGEAIPLDTFGVYRQKSTRIKQK